MSERILVVGTGLVGGSIGLRLRAGADVVVRGVDAVAENTQRAMELGALDEVADDMETAVDGADLIVVATPVGEVLPTITKIAMRAAPGTIVTDVGSTKSGIVAHAERLLGPDRTFVGGHPMAGTEGEGIASARADLFDDALWILTPTDQTDSGAYRRVNALVASLGARSLALDAAEHDRLVALVSHLPYAIATSLMAVAGDEGDERVFRAAAGSFRDVTRTAGSNPRIWQDIFATNRDAVVRELDEFAATLQRLRDAIAHGASNDIDELIGKARAARKRFPPKGERTPADPVTLEVGIPDRAGVLAEITTAIGQGGINIEDLWVDHTAAGGVLRLVVDGHDVARRAAELLTSKEFRTTIVEER
ncbi:MAG TPA: prephenate dehydrogenase [Actinomycetota bacterium]|jgi:prephenate dehydrogenase|nr:prephenate dehydrogenase [Actinomycetota bacterium]